MSKGLEALAKITGTQNLTMYEQNECLKNIEKQLKALEIIKKSIVEKSDTKVLMGDYYRVVLALTQEEYDFLKEVCL